MAYPAWDFLIMPSSNEIQDNVYLLLAICFVHGSVLAGQAVSFGHNWVRRFLYVCVIYI